MTLSIEIEAELKNFTDSPTRISIQRAREIILVLQKEYKEVAIKVKNQDAILYSPEKKATLTGTEITSLNTLQAAGKRELERLNHLINALEQRSVMPDIPPPPSPLLVTGEGSGSEGPPSVVTSHIRKGKPVNLHNVELQGKIKKCLISKTHLDEINKSLLVSPRRRQRLIPCGNAISEKLTLEYSIIRDEKGTPYIFFDEGMLGKGEFGQVDIGQNLRTGEWVTIKKMKVPRDNSVLLEWVNTLLDSGDLRPSQVDVILKSNLNPGKFLFGEREIENAKAVGDYYGSMTQNTGNPLYPVEYYLITPFKRGDSLNNYLKSNLLDFLNALQFAISITNELKKLHEKNIIHLDIKSSNIIVHLRTRKPVFIDWGFGINLNSIQLKSKIKEGVFSSAIPVGTRHFKAPETTTPNAQGLYSYSKGTDIFSLAQLFGDSPRELKEPCLELIKKAPPEMKSVIETLLADMKNSDPKRRPSCTTILTRLNEIKAITEVLLNITVTQPKLATVSVSSSSTPPPSLKEEKKPKSSEPISSLVTSSTSSAETVQEKLINDIQTIAREFRKEMGVDEITNDIIKEFLQIFRTQGRVEASSILSNMLGIDSGRFFAKLNNEMDSLDANRTLHAEVFIQFEKLFDIRLILPPKKMVPTLSTAVSSASIKTTPAFFREEKKPAPDSSFSTKKWSPVGN